MFALMYVLLKNLMHNVVCQLIFQKKFVKSIL